MPTKKQTVINYITALDTPATRRQITESCNVSDSTTIHAINAMWDNKTRFFRYIRVPADNGTMQYVYFPLSWSAIECEQYARAYYDTDAPLMENIEIPF